MLDSLKLSALILAFLTTSCGGTSSTTDQDRLLVSGRIIQDPDCDRCYQGEFVFTPDSHAVVTLSYAEGADATSQIIARKKLVPITGFPIEFKIEGDSEAAFSQSGGEYSIHVEVHSEASEEMFEGDLMSEYYLQVLFPGQGITVPVSGLELCGSENSGGFCTNKTRSD